MAASQWIDTDRFNELVGAIYDCSLDPSGWDRVLQSLADELRCVGALIAVHDMTSGTSLLSHSVGFNEEFNAKLPAYEASFQELWSHSRVDYMTWPVDEPLVTTRCIPAEALAGNSYYVDFVRPQGLIDSIGFMPLRQNGRVGDVGFGRHESEGFITDREVDLLRLFAPHMRRAITISNLLDMQKVERRSLEAVLERLTCGVLLVNSDGRVMHANGLAERQLSAGDPLRLEAGHLVARHPPVQAALMTAVASQALNKDDWGSRGIGIPCRTRLGEACVLHVLPLDAAAPERRLSGHHAAAAVFITPVHSGPLAPVEAIGALYDLTPAERRVLASLLTGKSEAEIARGLAVSQSTVHTHLLRIFSKTGVSRQVDLLQLAQSLSAPVT